MKRVRAAGVPAPYPTGTGLANETLQYNLPISARRADVLWAKADNHTGNAYSVRRACTGEIEAARKAGINAAVSAEKTMAKTAMARIIGSYRLTP